MTTIPLNITAGLTLALRIRASAFMPADWSLRLMLRGASTIDVNSTPATDTGEHLLTVTAADTLSWTPGEYLYSLRAVRGGDVNEIESGRLTVAPSFESITDGTDVRRQCEITLANIEAVLQKRATTDQQRYSIGNRELWRTPIPELLTLRAHYRAELRRMRALELGLSALGQVIRPIL